MTVRPSQKIKIPALKKGETSHNFDLAHIIVAVLVLGPYSYGCVKTGNYEALAMWGGVIVGYFFGRRSK